MKGKGVRKMVTYYIGKPWRRQREGTGEEEKRNEGRREGVGREGKGKGKGGGGREGIMLPPT